jgi:D-tyrosyl-tRNA(Tyr) deacylase
MRIVLQRVSRAGVTVSGRPVAEIGPGLLALVGVASRDTAGEARHLAEKAVNLRIFDDEAGKLNRSLLETGGRMLAVSQFTLLGDCRKGRRPSFTAAAAAGDGLAIFEAFVSACRALGAEVQVGEFGAVMRVELVNEGPVTLILESGGRQP